MKTILQNNKHHQAIKNMLCLLFLTTSSLVQAQSLSINDVDAYIGDVSGVLFKKPLFLAGYEVPKNSGINAIYATSLWCAGEDVNGQLRLAAMRQGLVGNDFFPGPYSSTNNYTSASYVSEYGTSKWEISKAEIQNHISNYSVSGYVMPTSISTWPANGIAGVGVAQNLAPFIDMNNNGIYEPNLGEYPDVRGDLAIYTIMNDAKAAHGETGGEIMGIEIHTMAYQYATNDYRNKTTYLNYKVFNRGASSYQNFKLGIWSDFDLGNKNDDYIGCDTLRNMMYVYNGDNMDENGSTTLGYQADPPAVGISSLTKQMASFNHFTNGAPFPYTDPMGAAQFYNYMNGLWANGTQMYYGGNGAQGQIGTTTTLSSFMFSGNPNNAGEWSELSLDGGTNFNPQGDRRGVMTLEAEILPIGSSSCYDFAILYSREPGNNNLQNVNSLIALAATAKTDFDAMWTYNCNSYTALGINELDESKISVYPNPSRGNFTVSFGNDLLSGQIIITDLNGRIVFSEDIKNETFKTVHFNTQSGVYNVSIKTDLNTIHKRLIIAE